MPYALQARWLVPIDRPPIAGGIVSIDGGRIVAVGENVSGRPPTDLGHVAVLPGFVNAHTHLEFSSLDKPLGGPAMPFADWIAQVVSWRRELAEQFAGVPRGLEDYRRSAIAAGLLESQRAGIAAVGEIAMPEASAGAYAHSGNVAVVALVELLGLSEDRVEPLMDVAASHIAAARAAGVLPGLAPHATYTVHPQLLRRACELSAAEEIPLALHIAESRQELRLLAYHSGPLVELLASLGAWFPSALPRGLRPLDYLETLQNAHRALVIHGNHLTSEEIEFIAARRERMSIVYCPRTRAYFGRARYPLSEMLRAGARVAVGTDSRASNPDLSVLAELRHIASHHRDIAPAKILEMGTLAAAEALGIDADYGSIAVGKRAAFAVLPVMELRCDPCEHILQTEVPALSWPPAVVGNDQ